MWMNAWSSMVDVNTNATTQTADTSAGLIITLKNYLTFKQVIWVLHSSYTFHGVCNHSLNLLRVPHSFDLRNALLFFGIWNGYRIVSRLEWIPVAMPDMLSRPRTRPSAKTWTSATRKTEVANRLASTLRAPTHVRYDQKLDLILLKFYLFLRQTSVIYQVSFGR